MSRYELVEKTFEDRTLSGKLIVLEKMLSEWAADS
jgi:hypothetical protein